MRITFRCCTGTTCTCQTRCTCTCTNCRCRFNGLTETDFNTLARYNGERAHGIMHTPEWQEKMDSLQARFDATERERWHARATPKPGQ